jgi:hypothetical protein
MLIAQGSGQYIDGVTGVLPDYLVEEDDRLIAPRLGFTYNGLASPLY